MYEHTAVRTILENERSHECKQDRACERSHHRADGWKFWLDDVPVCDELHAYGSTLQKLYPCLKFLGTSHVYTGGVGLQNSVYVCMDVSPYALGTIDYRDNSLSGRGGRTFSIYARTVKNDKYHLSRSQYNMKMSSSLGVAVKNALAHLIPYSAVDIARVEYKALRDRSIDSGKQKAAVLPALLAAVTSSVLLNEVRALKAAGVAFSTPEFQSIVSNMDEATQLANAEHSKRVDAVLVHFVDRAGGITVAECADLSNVRGQTHPTISSCSIGNNVTRYAMADVPKFIVEKVAVMRGLDDGSHVDGIGMKIEDRLFWVEK